MISVYYALSLILKNFSFEILDSKQNYRQYCMFFNQRINNKNNNTSK